MILPINHISSKTEEALEYVVARQEGSAPILKTGIPKLDKALMGGLEWERILTIGALSGGGKSITLEELKKKLIELNTDQQFDVLSFEFEMPTKDNLVRNVSSTTEITSSDLYSVDEPLKKADLLKVKKALADLNKQPVYIVDIAGDVQAIHDTIMDFVQTRQLGKRGRNIVITLDHTLLTKGRQSQAEKQVIDELMQMFVGLKKELSYINVKSITIVLSQLNRNLETKERVLNSALHYPTKNDIFAASSVYYCSDYVLITHKPANVNGISQYYGPPVNTAFPKGLPVFNPDDPDQAMVYWHLIKNRFGKQGIIPMLDRFDVAKLEQAQLTGL